jgi:hypothetical protein
MHLPFTLGWCARSLDYISDQHIRPSASSLFGYDLVRRGFCTSASAPLLHPVAMSLNSSPNIGPSYQDWKEILGSKSVTAQSGVQTGTEKSDADTASDMTVHRPSSPRSEKETPDMFELLMSNTNLRPFSRSDDEHEDKEFE